jgi:hypothetical protein
MHRAINIAEDQQKGVAPSAGSGIEQAKPPFPSLVAETRLAVDTACAAWHLNRRPQTLRCWAVYGDGPIRPIRVHGRLAWSTSEIRNLLGVTA